MNGLFANTEQKKCEQKDVIEDLDILSGKFKKKKNSLIPFLKKMWSLFNQNNDVAIPKS